jgi:HEPN domain-containing protein
MLKLSDLALIAKARLEDASVLFNQGRYDGANYLCGYAVEIALKFRAARTLNWKEFPETSGEFGLLRSFQVHDLDALLRLSGQEEEIKRKFISQWSAVSQWNPESRYKPIGNVTQRKAGDMIENAKIIVAELL